MAKAPPWEELTEDQKEAIKERLRRAVEEELERLRRKTEEEARKSNTGS